MNKICTSCNFSTSERNKFCPDCGHAFPVDTNLSTDLTLLSEPYRESYGLWKVTTEGDCEGRTTKQLGTHEGYIDEIAKALAPQCCYSLKFDATVPLKSELDEIPAHGKVGISFNIDSKTWNMSGEQRAAIIGEVLKNRAVSVEPSNYYAAATLVW